MRDNLTTAFKALHIDKGQEVSVSKEETAEDFAEMWVQAVIEGESFLERMPTILQGIANKEELEEEILAQLEGLTSEEGELLLYDILEEEPETREHLYQLPQLALLYSNPPEWTAPAPEGEDPESLSLNEWVERAFSKRLDKVKSVDHYKERVKAIQALLTDYEGEEKEALIHDAIDKTRRAE